MSGTVAPKRTQQTVALLVVALFSGSGLALLDGSVPGAGPVPAAEMDSEPHELDAGLQEQASKDATSLLDEVVFEQNLGQADPQTLFTAKTASGEVLLSKEGLTFMGAGDDSAEMLYLAFQDPSPDVVVQGEQPQTLVGHHYSGDASQWVQATPHFSQIRYAGLHPGIDLVVYGTPDGHVEFDHVIAPGADPAQARYTVSGSPELEEGALVEGGFRLRPPVAHHDTPAGPQEVPVAFRLDGRSVSYELGAYDAARSLVVDPVVTYSSYLGTSTDDVAVGVAVAPGPSPDVLDVYVGGNSYGNGFPGFANTTTHGSGGVFVAKFEYDRKTRTTTPQWIAYIGGGADTAYNVEADAQGLAIVGTTASTFFPVQNPLQIPSANYDGSSIHGSKDAFAMRLDTNGNLVFSTYLGGEGDAFGYGVDLGPDGHLLVTGQAWYQDAGAPFPTVNAPQPYPQGSNAAFAVKINTSTSPASAVFSTLIGGLSSGQGISEDATGVTVGGWASKPAQITFPTTIGAYQPAPAVDPMIWSLTGFIVKIPRDGGPQWIYSTLLNGQGNDEILALDTDAAGNAWVTGRTSSQDFPTTPNALSSTHGGGFFDAFLVQISSDGSRLLYGSYIGGPGGTEGQDIDVLPSGHVLLAGITVSSTGIPLQNLPPPLSTSYYGFVLRLEAATGALNFGTYLGGTGVRSPSVGAIHRIAGDDASNIFAAGETRGGFPLVLPHQPNFGGGYYRNADAFLTIIGKAPPQAVIEADASAFGHPVETTPLTTSYDVLTSEEILLDGSASLPGDDPINLGAVVWELKDGNAVVASDGGTWTPTFSGFDPLVMATPKVYTVCLTVEDITGGPYNHNDTVCMDLEWQNRPPTASIADCQADQVAAGREVVLTPVAKDPENGPLTFVWDWDDGNTSTGDPGRHTYAENGTYRIMLTATDAEGDTDAAWCELVVRNGPQAEFSYEGSLLMTEEVVFQDLSIAGEHPIQTWSWDFDDGTSLERSVPSDFGHVFDAPGNYTVSLTVFDGNLSDAVTHEVHIMKAEPLPVPDAYRAVLGIDLEVPVLQGLLANDGHTGQWPLEVDSYTQPDRGSVLVDTDGSFTYTPPQDFVGIDTFTYHVTDGPTVVGPVQVEVEVPSAVPPQADFAFQVSGNTVVFEDQSVRGDRPIMEWHWTFSDGSEATGQEAYLSLEPGHHSATLHVTDSAGVVSSVTKQFQITSGPSEGGGHESTAPELVVEASEVEAEGVTADATNQPPTAVALAALEATATEEILLDASRSSDPDGDELTFRWRQVEGPPGVLKGLDQAEALFAPSRSGRLVFELEVSDGQATDVAEVSVAVLAAEAPDFEIEVLQDGTHWFNATSEGSWSFGDGNTTNGRSVSHRFAEPGAYAVRFEADGRESVQIIRVASDEEPDLRNAEPAVEAAPEHAQIASVPEPRIPIAVSVTAAGVGLLFLLVWVYRTWALVWIRVFTRVGRPEILDHPLRSQIHDAVADRPGVLLTDLVDLLGKSRRTVAHHVGMLEGAGMLSVTRSGRYVSLRPAGAPVGEAAKESVLRSSVAQRLLEATAAVPGQTASDLARHLGVTQQAVSKQVARLESAGLVRKVKEGRTTRIYAGAVAS